jgi:uncharacterized protein YjbJ (UPF0337 family)
MSDNHVAQANGRVKDAAGNFTTDKIVKNDSQADRATTIVTDEGNNLVDSLPGRGTE